MRRYDRPMKNRNLALTSRFTQMMLLFLARAGQAGRGHREVTPRPPFKPEQLQLGEGATDVLVRALAHSTSEQLQTADLLKSLLHSEVGPLLTAHQPRGIWELGLCELKEEAPEAAESVLWNAGQYAEYEPISPFHLLLSLALSQGQAGSLIRSLAPELVKRHSLTVFCRFRHGSPSQVESLEQRLKHEPDQLFLRLMLMGHYFHTGGQRFVEHALWLVHHYPETDLLQRFLPDEKLYQKALQLWNDRLPKLV